MHPTKQQWQTVIDNFEKVLPLSEREGCGLNMIEGSVNDYGHVCGTIHCVGGWYAVATELHKSRLVNYNDGADKMARDLGINDHSDLETWAHENPEIWGTDYGREMFCSRQAYDISRNTGLRGVIEHLKGVRDRSPENIEQ